MEAGISLEAENAVEPPDDLPAFATYRPNPTSRLFHYDDQSLVRALMSGIGCGKSSACVVEIPLWAAAQAPDRNGIRPTRFAVIRSTYSELKSTTIQTWKEWIPETVCKIVYDSPIRGLLQFPLPDGTQVHSEIYFMPLGDAESVRRLLSLELTGAWINEAAEIPSESILSDVFSRCGRYPSPTKRVPWTRKGVIMDYNPPPVGSWLYKLFETDMTPDRYTLYKFPPPLLVEHDSQSPGWENAKFLPNPAAENVDNVHGYSYWMEQLGGYKAQRNWNKITRFLLGDYPHAIQGRAIFDAFSPFRHVKKKLPYSSGELIVAGFDGGTHPACAITQFRNGTVYVLKEFTSPKNNDPMGMEELLDRHVIPWLKTNCGRYKLICSIDPSGINKSELDLRNLTGIFHKRNLVVRLPTTNAFMTRVDVGQWFLRQHDGIYIDSECETIVNGLAGGYAWKEKASGSDSKLEPNKNFASHVCDALVYALMFYKTENYGYYNSKSDQMQSRPRQFAPSRGRSNDDYFYV